LAHCNFKLREAESDQDEAFVKSFAKKLKVPFYAKSFDTSKYVEDKKLSIQMAARELRYNWFQELLVEQKLDFIVTGHQLDDNLETVLLNLTRGTGLEGLTGIPLTNGKIVRPLLPFSRAQIEVFANEKNISWREDTSNQSQKYSRNKIRHQVVPALKEINPQLLSSFQNTLQFLKGSQKMLQECVQTISKNLISTDKTGLKTIDIQKLKQENHQEVILFEILKPYGFTAWSDIQDLLDAQSGKRIFSPTHELLKNREFLLLRKIPNINGVGVFEIDENQSKLQLPNAQLLLITSSRDARQCVSDKRKNNDLTAMFDKSQLKFPLTVRKWKKGDYFYPQGMKGKKKLSDYFKNEKMSLFDKENVWLLCSGAEIVWVVGKRIDHRFRVTEHTSEVVSVIFNYTELETRNQKQETF